VLGVFKSPVKPALCGCGAHVSPPLPKKRKGVPPQRAPPPPPLNHDVGRVMASYTPRTHLKGL